MFTLSSYFTLMCLPCLMKEPINSMNLKPRVCFVFIFKTWCVACFTPIDRNVVRIKFFN